MRLGLSSGAFYPAVATEDIPSGAASLGVTDLEVMLQTAGEYGPAVVGSLAANVRDAGCRIWSVHLWTDLHRVMSPYPRRVAEGVDLFRRGIEAARELDARWLVWHGPAAGEVVTAGDWDRFVAIAVSLVAGADEAGVGLTVENTSRHVLRGPREVARLATGLRAALPDARWGFTFDPFQAAEAGTNPFMTLAAMGDRLANVHLSDHRPGAGRHLIPGDGDLPWPALLRAIGATYRGPLILESAIAPDAAAAVARVRALIGPHRLPGDANAPADPCQGDPPPGVVEGIALFNDRQFYACHETIEHEWHAERREIRRLYQGILQIGVGFHHALRGNHRGAVSVLGDGVAKVTRFTPACLGIDTARLAREAGACLATLHVLGPAGIAAFDPATIPSIHPAAASDRLPGTDTDGPISDDRRDA
ncbi:MAG: DUF309 domain-containing protein [Chloroflexota bacterium]|nr:DUF309 domain-containing protein [Chloroflexota bacterium]